MHCSRFPVFQAPDNTVVHCTTSRSGFNLSGLCLLTCLVLTGAILPVTPVQSAIIQRTITIDGDMTDWKGPPLADITTNAGQFSTDAEGDANTGSPADLDFEVQGTGRDLEGFSFTYDDTNLYLWVKRYASTNNKTDWWFYIDTNNNGLMESNAGHTDNVMRVAWSGSNGNTALQFYDYVEAAPGGDLLVCPATGLNSVADGWCPVADIADGYDMPGTTGVEYALSLPDAGSQNGGSTSGASTGVEMETRISWAMLGLPAGPGSVGFHISTSNGSNIPAQVNDNMNGADGGGGSIAFSELSVTKSASVTTIFGGGSFVYSVAVTNNGSSDATNVSLDDALPLGVSYSSYIASVGVYDDATGVWSIGSLANGITATLDITVTANLVAIDTVVTNTASNLILDQGDPDTSNNQDSIDVTVLPLPDILVLKSAQTIEDPVNGSTNPKSIPGAIVLYTITLINQGLSPVDADTFVITDPVPSNAELFVGDLSAGSPVAFVDGATSSGLSLGFTSLSSTTDDIEFSSVGGGPYNYTPVPDVDGYDAGVTDFGLLTRGSFAASDGVNHPSFSVIFKVRIQ